MTRMPAPALNAPADAATEVPPAAPSLPYQGSDIVDAELVAAYVPRIVQQHLAAVPETLVDSGRDRRVRRRVGLHAAIRALARKGREGAEQITDVIGDCFESILEVAYDHGGEPTQVRRRRTAPVVRGRGSCRPCVPGRGADAPRAARGRAHRVAGCHGHAADVAGRAFGRVPLFRSRHLASRAAPGRARMEPRRGNQHVADADEIVVSRETAALLPDHVSRARRRAGIRLRARARRGRPRDAALPATASARGGRSRVACRRRCGRMSWNGGATPEHRPVTIAFLRFEGTDALIGATADRRPPRPRCTGW